MKHKDFSFVTSQIRALSVEVYLRLLDLLVCLGNSVYGQAQIVQQVPSLFFLIWTGEVIWKLLHLQSTSSLKAGSFLNLCVHSDSLCT